MFHQNTESENSWSSKETAMIAHNITVTATYRNLETRYHSELTEEFEKYEAIQKLEGAERQAAIEKTLWYRMMRQLQQIQAEYGPLFSKEQCDPNGNAIIFNPIAGANCYTVGLSKTEIPNEKITSEDAINLDDVPESNIELNLEVMTEEQLSEHYLLNAELFLINLLKKQPSFALTDLVEIDFFWEHGIKDLTPNDQFHERHNFIRKTLSWYLAAIDEKEDVMALSTVENRLQNFAIALHDCLRADNILERDRRLTKEQLAELEKRGEPDPFNGATDNGKEAHTACSEGFRVKFCERFFTLHPSNVFVANPNFTEIAGKVVQQTLDEQYFHIHDLGFKEIIKAYHDSPGDFPPGFGNFNRHKDRDSIDHFEKTVMDSAILKIEQDYKLDLNDQMLHTINSLNHELTCLKKACDQIGLRGIAMMDITYDYGRKKVPNTSATKPAVEAMSATVLTDNNYKK